MKLTLISRNETVDNPRIHLQFADADSPPSPQAPYPPSYPPPVPGVLVSGHFERELAMSLEVGKTYTLILNPVE